MHYWPNRNSLSLPPLGRLCIQCVLLNCVPQTYKVRCHVLPSASCWGTRILPGSANSILIGSESQPVAGLTFLEMGLDILSVIQTISSLPFGGKKECQGKKFYLHFGNEMKYVNLSHSVHYLIQNYLESYSNLRTIPNSLEIQRDQNDQT